MAAKIVGALVLADVIIDMELTSAGTPIRTLSIPDGIYYALGDGTAQDLCAVIEAEALAAGAELAVLSCSVTADGSFVFAVGVGDVLEITWTVTTSATELRDDLRFSGAVTTVAPTSTGSQPVRGSYFPIRAIVEDLAANETVGSQAVADDGTAETITYALQVGHRLEVHAEGQPYAGAVNEYTALQSFVEDHAAKGCRFRYYRDAANTTPYTIANPGGYSIWRAAFRSVQDWAPVPYIAGWYQHFRWSFRLLQASE